MRDDARFLVAEQLTDGNTVISNNLKESIRLQRELLTGLLGEAMLKLANRCAVSIDERERLETTLSDALPQLLHCKHLYVLDKDGIQVTDNITLVGPDHSHFARNRIDRPYMQGIIGSTDFKLSEAYISRNKRRPGLTAVQVIRNDGNERIGFLGADYDLRELPHTEECYQESYDWRQIKGDPAIRRVVFQQERIESQMDAKLDDIFPVVYELMTQHGVFHSKFHFSSSLLTIWLASDPFTYRILNFDELTDPDICLVYAKYAYHRRAIVPPESIMPAFELFRSLRFADENIYLRGGSLNVINGMVALNFSCDGSHYMRCDEFLTKNGDFWFGTL